MTGSLLAPALVPRLRWGPRHAARHRYSSVTTAVVDHLGDEPTR